MHVRENYKNETTIKNGFPHDVLTFEYVPKNGNLENMKWL
jgi:hypothetical protein